MLHQPSVFLFGTTLKLDSALYRTGNTGYSKAGRTRLGRVNGDLLFQWSCKLVLHSKFERLHSDGNIYARMAGFFTLRKRASNITGQTLQSSRELYSYVIFFSMK